MGLLEKIKSKLTVNNSVDFFNDLREANEETLGEATLKALGIQIPLPSQQEAYDFYVAFEGLKPEEKPTSPLAFLNPENWTKSQYLKYQADVKEWGVKNKFKSARSSRSLRKIKLQSKVGKLKKEERLKWIESFNADFAKNLKDNTPKDLKPGGIQRFPELLWALLKVTIQYTMPSILKMFEDLDVAGFEERKQALLEKLGIDDIKNVSKEDLLEFCPTEEVLDQIIKQRNGLVQYLNNQQTKIDNINITVNGTGEVANFLQTANNILIATNLIATAVANALPAILPRVVLVIQTVETFRKTLITKNDGGSRITPLIAVVNNVNIPLNALSALITKIVLALGSIDEIINICRPNATIDNLSPEVLLTVALELSADASEDNFLYKGFRLEIETKIYSDVVNQNRAIGINQSGITMITTEYSFASDPNVLINELKFIIDRDGLKSY